jgi:hypothetical protein
MTPSSLKKNGQTFSIKINCRPYFFAAGVKNQGCAPNQQQDYVLFITNQAQ